MPDEDAITSISTHVGPSVLVSIGFGRRASFADAWNDPALRLRAINAAIRALDSERITAGTAPRAASKQISTINNLLLDLLMQD